MLADNELIALKEDAMRQEEEASRTIQDLEVRISQATNDRNALNFEYTKASDSYNALRVNVDEKIKGLEDRYAQQQRAYRQLEASTKATAEQAKGEHDQEVADLIREYTSRIETAEATLKSMLEMRDATEQDYKSLNVNFMQEQNKHQEAIVDLESRIREEIKRNFDSRFAALES
jgi:chromosome segregation ATPase